MADVITPSERKGIDHFIQTKEQFSEGEVLVCYVDIISDKEKAKKPKRAIMLIGNNRLYFFKPQSGKHLQDMPFFDLVEIKSDNPTEIVIKLRNETVYTLTFSDPLDVNDTIAALVFLFAGSFSGVPLLLRLKLSVTPKERLKVIFPDSDPNDLEGSADEFYQNAQNRAGGCGGFSTTYTAMCDYSNIIPMHELNWHVDNVLSPNNARELDLSGFGAIEKNSGVGMKPIMAALGFNKWFTTLRITSLKLQNEALSSIQTALTHNRHISKLILHKLGLSKDFCERLADALLLNTSLPLTYLDLRGNALEDKGFFALAEFFKKTTMAIDTLLLADCGAGKSGTSELCYALAANPKILESLARLDLSGNKLDVDGSSALSTLLNKTTGVSNLSLENTSLAYFHLKKCAPLQILDMSGNKFTKKEQLHLDLLRFLGGSPFLNKLIISHTSPPIEMMEDLLGAKASCAPTLSDLDVSECDFSDENMDRLFHLIAEHPMISRINVSGNFVKGKAKARVQAIESLITMVETKAKTPVPILSIGIAGTSKGSGHLRHDIAPFIFSLMNNSTLTHLDVSNHLMGDLGAIAIGKLLQINNSLTSLEWDENNTSLLGFIQFKIGLSRNFGLKIMPLPLIDIAAALKADTSPASQERLNQIAIDIQSLLDKTSSVTPITGGWTFGETPGNSGWGKLPLPSPGSSEPPVVDPRAACNLFVELRAYTNGDN
eukprot:TRINITY_DN88_c0_g3_i2.p1 TRINITY_DN88_c0_g3~~TRINITY_DN88_c0_g3_i2.p1  ORF type:complete len:717 (-),score=132.85 TRINITY_DN88_c0_g3_i2:80-2230(-)